MTKFKLKLYTTQIFFLCSKEHLALAMFNSSFTIQDLVCSQFYFIINNNRHSYFVFVLTVHDYTV